MDEFKISDLPFELRPREKLRRLGPAFLTNSELLAILIGSGRPKENALTLSKKLIEKLGGLQGLASADLEEIEVFRGLGPAKASKIIACLELAKRLYSPKLEEKILIRSPSDVYQFFYSEMCFLDKEYFKVIILNVKNAVVKVVDVAVGSLSAALVHPRELFKVVIKANACRIIIVHNHPSGDPSPSDEDMNITRRLKKGAQLLGIKLLDHVIVGKEGFFSFKENGLL